jgi:hypothetical protein
MAQSTRRLGAGWLCAVLATGCGQRTDKPAPQQISAPQGTAEPGEVELSDLKATLRDPTTVLFEVSYRFTKGRPNKVYSCEISFPGHPEEHAVKRMESWELKMEGVIKDGVVLSGPGAKSLEIHMAEAPSQQGPFRKISNVANAPVK